MFVTDVSWLSDNHIGGCGFYIFNGYKRIVIAGSSNLIDGTTLDAELKALEIGLNVVVDWILNIAVIFMDSVRVQQALMHSNTMTAWRLNQRIFNIRRMLNLNQVNIEVIPRDWNNLVDKVAAHGR